MRENRRFAMPWWIWAPLLLFVGEVIWRGFYPFTRPYFLLLVTRAAIPASYHLAIAALRVLAVGLIFAILVELLFSGKERIKFFIFFGMWWIYFYFQSQSSPNSIIGVHRNPLYLLAVFWVTAYLFIRDQRMCSASVRKTIVVGALALLFIFFTAPGTWEGKGQTPKHSDPTKPSFFLLSFDSVPGEFFQSRGIFSRWSQNWRHLSKEYLNAYTVINSTFASLFSVLSGQYPHETKVDTLYPNPREGIADLSKLISWRLSEMGYRTVFMTDCATTGFLKEQYGFDELWQVDRGGYQCAKAIVESQHSLLFPVTEFAMGRKLFPELDTFCSSTYRPKNFFEQVTRKISQLKQSTTPYLLMVHSCVTHHDVAEHLSAEEFRFPAVSTPSEKRKKLYSSLNLSDRYIDSLLRSLGEQSTWAFIYADHGVRIDDPERHFSHVSGRAINRFQYHVPLAVLPPRNVDFNGTEETQVSLLDIYPTIEELAGLSTLEFDGKSLLHPIGERTHLLTSAISHLEPDAESKETVKQFMSARFDPLGGLILDSEFTRRLSSERSYALLKLPYREEFQEGSLEKHRYHELWDPFAKYPKTIHESQIRMARH